MLQFLTEQSRDRTTCGIETLTIAGHGWNYRLGSSGGPGIPGVGSSVGFYMDSTSGLNPGSATISDLKAKISSKEIRFEKYKCVIQIHSCRVSQAFSRTLANTTKCRVIGDTASAYVNKDDPTDDQWYSGPKNTQERDNSPYIGWYEITPGSSLKDKVLGFFGFDTTTTQEIGRVYDPE